MKKIISIAIVAATLAGMAHSAYALSHTGRGGRTWSQPVLGGPVYGPRGGSRQPVPQQQWIAR